MNMQSQEGGNRTDGQGVVLHASAVAVAGSAVVIEGPSGSGKSSLALQLLAFGAELVADDRTRVFVDPETGRLVADAPPTLPALIEARGVGLLKATLCGPRAVGLVVDLGHAETERLPRQRTRLLLGHSVALLHGAGNAHFAHAVFQYLKGHEDP